MPTIDNPVVNKRRTASKAPPYKPVDPDFVVLCSRVYHPQRFRFKRDAEGGGWELIMELIEADWIPMRHRNELWLYAPPGDSDE
jgi:hypothetical protein